MRLSIANLKKGLEFVGEVTSIRQHYMVMKSDKVYYVLSMSNAKPNSGNFNLIAVRAVEYLGKRLKGKRGVTTKSVFARTKRPRMLTTQMQVLNAFYVLVASGGAIIDGRRKGRTLYFNVR